jgi:glycosyltransferase involved in cell wall biosynthesis
MSAQARPELSVIVSCLNEERNVAELASRVNAVFTALGIEGEIVFVDDGSSDGTESAVERVRAEQAGVLLVRHCVNRGVVESWYSGFAASTGRLSSPSTPICSTSPRISPRSCAAAGSGMRSWCRDTACGHAATARSGR